MFENEIKEIYLKSNAREYKKINVLIQILPYINMQYNVVCKNPYVENREELKLISLNELTTMVGYKNSSRLKKRPIQIKSIRSTSFNDKRNR